MIIEFKSIQREIFELHKYKQKRGVLVGFPSLDRIYSILPGTSTIIYGYPTSGKSQLLFQIIVSLACQGKKTMIFSPESGTATEIFAELIHAVTAKTFRESLNYTITEREIYNVAPFIQEYFKVVEIGETSLNPEQFCEITKQGIKDFGIFASAFDNWNDLSHNSSLREDLYIEQSIPMFNRLARKEQIHIFGVWHAKNPQINVNNPVPQMPTPFEIKGGSAIYSKAMNLIGVHRDYEQTQHGWKQSNVATIAVNKIKPKAGGEKGFCKLTFNPSRNAYYDTVMGVDNYVNTGFNSNFI